MVMTNNVAIYIRVSTSYQADEGYSIDEQREKLESYCKIKDWNVYDVYTDGGFSGSSTERPALEKLIRDAKKKQFDTVLVYKLDRLSRSQKDTLYLIEDVFIANDISFFSLQENFDTSTPFGKAMIGLLSVFAQLEREQIKERMLLGKEGRAKSGKSMSWTTIPFGYEYSKETGILTINPTHAAIVKQIFLDYTSGKSIIEIIKDLNADGHIGREKPWGETILKYLLRNETYLGKVKYKGMVYDGSHEPIISQELFDLTQIEINRRQVTALERNNNPRPFQAKYMLSGLLKCGYCGASLGLYATPKNKKGISHHKYQCRNRYNKDLEKRCPSKWYSRETLESEVLTKIEKIKLDPKYRKLALASKTEKNDITKLKKQLSKLDEKKEKLAELYLDGMITRENLNLRNQKIKQEREFIERQIADNRQDPLEIRQQKIVKLLKGFDAKNLDYETTARIVKTIVREIVVTADQMTIELGF